MRSERNFDLVLSVLPLHEPTITVEAYCKWYDLYLVSPDGTVKAVGFDELDTGKGTPYSDHVPNPAAVTLFADKKGYGVDPLALEIIVGRWHMEHLNYNPY